MVQNRPEGFPVLFFHWCRISQVKGSGMGSGPVQRSVTRPGPHTRASLGPLPPRAGRDHPEGNLGPLDSQRCGAQAFFAGRGH